MKAVGSMERRKAPGKVSYERMKQTLKQKDKAFVLGSTTA